MCKLCPGLPRRVTELPIDVHERIEAGSVLDWISSILLVFPPRQASPAEDLVPHWVPPAKYGRLLSRSETARRRTNEFPRSERVRGGSVEGFFYSMLPTLQWAGV